MTDVKIINDEFGRPHPVKVEDLFQYGLEADGDTLATGVLKVKHIVFNQCKDADNLGQGKYFDRDFILPAGAAIYRAAWRTENEWTVDGSTADYVNLYLGTPDSMGDIIDGADIKDDGDDNLGYSVGGDYLENPEGVTIRLTVYAPAEHPDYTGGRSWLSFWYSVPTDYVPGTTDVWMVD
jgi:hypothetical protein